MTTLAMPTLITDTIADYGTALLAILSAVIGIGVAYLVFRFGWRKVKSSINAGESDRIFNDAQKHFGYKLNRKYYFRDTSWK